MPCSELNLEALVSGWTPFMWNAGGRPWPIDEATSRYLNSRLQPNMHTLETGAGLSTVIFAANGCRHTCIMPDNALAGRIVAYCQSANINGGAINFMIAKSCDVIPQLPHAQYDLALIDGNHNFPTVFIDFYYATKALKLGGTLIADDLQIYTCDLLARFIQSDPGWDVDMITTRVAIATKVADTLDRDWTEQRFVTIRSRLGSLMANPLYLARQVSRNLRAEGARMTIKKIFRRVLGNYT
jgi:hypothetical protein